MKASGLFRTLMAVGSAALIFNTTAHAQVNVTVERNQSDGDTPPAFAFKKVPAPSKTDAATKATFSIVDGHKDQFGGDLINLHDGKLPYTSNRSLQNFVFRSGTNGGRLLVDLGSPIEIKQINTYSWHTDTRGPQVYDVYSSDGAAAGFDAQPGRGVDPTTCGWKLVAKVDTRPKSGDFGGQYGVSISDSTQDLGKYRYLLFDVSQTETTDPWGNTFYSEIDVIDAQTPEPGEASTSPFLKVITAEGGKYQLTIDAERAPGMIEWAEKELGPVLQEWYPKIAEMLSSDGFQAPQHVTLEFNDEQEFKNLLLGSRFSFISAQTLGTLVSLNAAWFQRDVRNGAKSEALGCVVHELVHVVQQYGRARRNNPNAKPTPNWLSEGIPDYIRWFLYEPQTRGAELTRESLARARYDASYRVSGNFINWVTANYDKEIVRKLNAAARAGNYSEQLWKEYTGKTVKELNAEWKESYAKRFATPPAPNSL